MENKKTLEQKTGVNVNYHCQLMENYVAESNIDLGQGLEAIKINTNDGLVFFIDEATHRLKAVVMSDSQTGTQSHFVTDATVQVTAFAVHQDPDSKTFRITYAAQRNGNSELMVSAPIAIASLDLDHWNVNYAWSAKQLQQKNRIINMITMDEHGVLFSTSAPNSDADFYSFAHGEQPQFYTLPENGCQVQQIKVGKWAGHFGVFLLYTAGNNKTLLFKGLYPTEGEILQERFSTGKNINAFDLLRDEYDNSVLYTSGEGIGCFAGSDDDDGRMLSEATAGIEFFKIDVSNHEEEISIWAIGKTSEGSGLYYMTNKWHNQNNINSEVRWTNPLQMQEHIEEFASIKGEYLTNQLYLFGKTAENSVLNLIHFWQDSNTTWTEHTVSVENSTISKQLETYTIEINFDKKETCNINLGSAKVSLWVEEASLLYINNEKKFLIPQKKLELALDEMYNINVIYPTDSLSANSVFIAADFLDATIEISPTHGITETMSEKINTTDDLVNAQTKTGQPLLKQRLSTEELELITQSIGSLKTASNNFKNQPALQARGSTAPTVTMYIENQPQISGIVSEEGSVSGIFSWVGNALGDIWHGIKKGFQKVTNWVVSTVDGVWKFVVKIGEMVIDFVVDTVKKVVNVLGKIFETVKTFFKDLFEFLAYLFEWGDIIKTKNALKASGEKLLGNAKNTMEGYRKVVIQYFEDYKDVLKKQKIALDEKYKSNITFASLASGNGSQTTQETDPKLKWIASKRNVIFQEASLNASSMKKEDISELEKKGDENDVPIEIMNLFINFFKGNISVSEFAEKLMNRLLLFAVDLLESIIDKIFDWLIAGIDLVKNFFYGTIDVPILSHVYEKAAKGTLSVADFICLLIAIPMTVSYKLAYHEAPFQDGEVFNYVTF